MESDIKKMSFEEAMKELETLVTDLEGGNVPLDQAIKHYSRGAALQKLCQAKLEEATMKLETIKNESKAS